MLDGVVQAQLLQIKTASPVRTIQEIRREFRHEEAEGRRKVEGLPDFGVELFECDVSAVVGEDTVVGKGIQHRACGSRISFFGRNVFGPGEVVACGVAGDNVAGLERRCEEVEDEEPKVPGKDKQVDEEAGDFVQDAHVEQVCWVRMF